MVSAFGCSVRGPRFKSHHRWLYLSRWPLRYAALVMGCTLTAVLRSTQSCIPLRQAILIDCCTVCLQQVPFTQQQRHHSSIAHSRMAVSCKCEQCHVYNHRRRLNTVLCYEIMVCTVLYRRLCWSVFHLDFCLAASMSVADLCAGKTLAQDLLHKFLFPSSKLILDSSQHSAEGVLSGFNPK